MCQQPLCQQTPQTLPTSHQLSSSILLHQHQPELLHQVSQHKLPFLYAFMLRGRNNLGKLKLNKNCVVSRLNHFLLPLNLFYFHAYRNASWSRNRQTYPFWADVCTSESICVEHVVFGVFSVFSTYHEYYQYFGIFFSFISKRQKRFNNFELCSVEQWSIVEWILHGSWCFLVVVSYFFSFARRCKLMVFSNGQNYCY